MRRTLLLRLIWKARSSTWPTTSAANRASGRWRERTSGMAQTRGAARRNRRLKLRIQRHSHATDLQLINRNQAQQAEIAEHFAGAEHHGRERVVRDGNREAGFLPDAFIKIFDQHAAAIADIGGKLRRGAFQSDANGVDDR